MKRALLVVALLLLALFGLHFAQQAQGKGKSLTLAVGHVTSKEATSLSAVLDQVQKLVADGKPAGPALADLKDQLVQAYLYDADIPPPAFSWENAPFLDGQSFGYLTDPDSVQLPLLEHGAWGIYQEGGWQTAVPFTLPAQAAHSILWNNEQASWGDHGPLWGWRCYNVQGSIKNFLGWCVGDFTKGREGHLFYFDVLGDLTLDHCTAIECGAQFAQLVWRPSETLIPVADWHQGEHLIHVVDCTAINCGTINQGDSVRASWPLCVYNPGQNLLVERFKVVTQFAPYFDTSKNKMVQSHGAVFVGVGDSGYTRTPKADIVDLDAEVWSSDREMVRFWGVDNATLVRPKLVDHDGSVDVAIVDDCGSVAISQPKTALTVRIISAAKPYGDAYKVVQVAAGQDFTWP